VQNVNRLPELSPGRLVWIAEIIRDYPKDGEMLDRMLSVTDQRDLGLEPSLVQVLLWPRRPPKREPRPVRPQYAPPRAPQQATAAPELTPEPKPIIVEPVVADPEPKPIIDEPVVVDPEPKPIDEPAVEEAVSLIYRRRQAETCESVAEALHSVPMRDWDRDDFDRLKEALDGAADWFGDHNDMARTFFSFETSPILFGTADGVLIYENGPKILTWSQAMERIAPEVEEAERRREIERRQQEIQRIMRTKLPTTRKLKTMKSLLDEVTALQPTTIKPEAERAIDFIRAMPKDDEQFSKCQTFADYLHKVIEITAQDAQPTPAPSGSDQSPPGELIEPDAAPTNDDSAPSADAVFDAILAVDLGRDVETRKGAFFLAMQTAADKGVLPDDLAALLPFIREILTHDPDQTRRLFGFMNARGILGHAAEMMRKASPD
jgi:hypothetical protein